jgi:hypothetical protein
MRVRLWKESEVMRKVVRFSMLIVLASILSAGSIQAQESSTKAAQSSVETWLSLIDNESYAASWDTAATLFRNAVTQEKWQAAAQTAHAVWSDEVAHAEKRNVHNGAAWRTGWRVCGLPIQYEF